MAHPFAFGRGRLMFTARRLASPTRMNASTLKHGGGVMSDSAPRFLTPGTSGPSDSIEWGTPSDFFESMVDMFGGFDLDACAAGAHIAKCADFISPSQDALKTEWGPVGSNVFVNPPYGREIGPFVERAVGQAQAGRLVVALIPCRPDTRWFTEWVMPHAAQLYFIKGRLAYENWTGGVKTPATARAPMPSCVAVFRPGENPHIMQDAPALGLLANNGSVILRAVVF